MEQEYIPTSEVEELFLCCFYSLSLEELSEQKVMNVFSDFIVDHMRNVQKSDKRLFVTILGRFFRAKIEFKTEKGAMVRIDVQMGKENFVEMRSHAKAMYLLMLQNPEQGVKPEWSNSILFGKQEMVVKKLIGKPEEVVASFLGGFGEKHTFFYKRELT